MSIWTLYPLDLFLDLYPGYRRKIHKIFSQSSMRTLLIDRFRLIFLAFYFQVIVLNYSMVISELHQHAFLSFNWFFCEFIIYFCSAILNLPISSCQIVTFSWYAFSFLEEPNRISFRLKMTLQLKELLNMHPA